MIWGYQYFWKNPLGSQLVCHPSQHPSISGPVAPSDTGRPAEVPGGSRGVMDIRPLEMVTGLEAHQNGYDICICIYIYVYICDIHFHGPLYVYT